MNNMKSILWGVVLVLLGVLVGTNSLGITNIDIFFDGWWSLFIIIPCFIGLFSNEDKTGNIIGLLVGVILLLGMNNILDLDKIWKLIVPSIIVIIGLSLIFKNSFNSKVNDKINKLKQEIINRKLNVKISVDGGINEEVLTYVKEADILVSSSFILSDLDKNVDILKNS